MSVRSQKQFHTVKYRAPRASAADAAARVAARRDLMMEIARRRDYGGPAQGFSGAPRSGRARLLEHKTFDACNIVTVSSAADVNPAATPFAPVAGATGGCINQVPIGNSSITRVGRRMNITAVAIRGQVFSNTNTDQSHCAMILVWDRHPNKSAALPAWNTILNQQSADSLTNKDYAPRFKILRRWDFPVCGSAAVPTSAAQFNIDEFVKLKNKVTIWDAADTTGIVTDMIEGSLLLYTTSDEVAAGAKAPVFYLSTRIYFQDS